MTFRFQHHYSREEARALLPQIREWLEQLHVLRHQLRHLHRVLSAPLSEGADLGGVDANAWVKSMLRLRRVMGEFHRREIFIKDLDRGLVDFPAIVGGREVFLCWEKDEEDIEYWHELDSNYEGREPLPE